MNYSDLRNEIKLAHDPHDAWGSVMGAFFDLAGELWMRDDAVIPKEWRYKPGDASRDPRERDSYFFEIFQAATTSDLEKLGAVLNRWSEMLRSAGRSY